MPILVIERGENKGTSVRVEPGKVFVVGRENPQSCIELKDPIASRNHFEIREGDGGAWFIRDLKSRNGTSLNDERLEAGQPQAIRIGDKIQVGETILSFLSDEKEETAGGLVGKVIGGYKLHERLGRGGMGTVYKAEQLSLHRIVALKVLSAKLMADATFVEKFVSEARAAGQLNHPNIVQVFDVGSDRGVHFFSMELMSNESVGDLVSKQGPVPWERALDMLMDAARGLIYAEKKGIVHRDIKPDNLMLTPEGSVKIGDLGLAKQGDDSGPGEGGAIFGTPHFIAPEQAQGKPVDNRADLYSLGATFYRILTGKTPFSGDNVKEILLKQINEEPVPLQKLVPDLPPEMALVVGKLMKKKPDDRYRSAQGLLEDLDRIRIAYHVETHGAAQAAKRNKILAGVLGVAVLALGGVAWHFMNKDPVTITKIEKETNGNQNTNTGPTPEELRRQAEERARSALQTVQLEDKTFQLRSKGPDPFATGTWKTMEKEWLALAVMYEDMAKAHEGKEATAEAVKRAREIRKRLKEAAEDDARRTEAGRTAAKDLADEVGGLRDKGDVNAALALVRDAVTRLEKDHKGYIPDDLEATLNDLRKSIVDTAQAATDEAVAALKAAVATYPPGNLAEARAGLDAVLARSAPAAGGTQDRHLADIARLAKDAVEKAIGEARARAAAALDADNARYIATYRQVRVWAPADATPETPGTPFFEYRWDEVVAAWEKAAAAMQTPQFRARCQEKVEQARMCRSIFETVVARLASGDYRNPEFPEALRKGANIFLDRAPGFKPPTMEGVAIVRQMGGGRNKGWVDFREMTPAEYYIDFLRRGHSDVGLDAAGHLALSVFLAEAGEGQLSVEQLGAATTAGADMAGKYKAVSDWVNRELMAYADWKPVMDALGQYSTAREQDAAPNVIANLRGKVEKLAREFGLQESVRTTDYYLLHVLAEGDGKGHVAYPQAWHDEVLAPFGPAPAGGNGGDAIPGGGKDDAKDGAPPGGNGDPKKNETGTGEKDDGTPSSDGGTGKPGEDR